MRAKVNYFSIFHLSLELQADPDSQEVVSEPDEAADEEIDVWANHQVCQKLIYGITLFLWCSYVGKTLRNSVLNSQILLLHDSLMMVRWIYQFCSGG